VPAQPGTDVGLHVRHLDGAQLQHAPGGEAGAGGLRLDDEVGTRAQAQARDDRVLRRVELDDRVGQGHPDPTGPDLVDAQLAQGEPAEPAAGVPRRPQLDPGPGADAGEPDGAAAGWDAQPDAGADPVQLVHGELRDVQPRTALRADLDGVAVHLDVPGVHTGHSGGDDRAARVGQLGLCGQAPHPGADPVRGQEGERDRRRVRVRAQLERAADRAGHVDVGLAGGDRAGVDPAPSGRVGAAPVQVGDVDVVRVEQVRPAGAAAELQVYRAVPVVQVVAAHPVDVQTLEGQLAPAGLLGPVRAQPARLARPGAVHRDAVELG
jgi:hypothetical protein